MRSDICLLLKAITLLLFSVTLPAGAVRPSFGTNIIRDEPLQIPITDPSGGAETLQGHICFPDSPQHPQVVVINHGSPPSEADRPGLKLAGCHSETVHWFLSRHYAVAMVARLGYGATGGSWTEGYHQCDKADFYKAGLETARQIKTTVDFLAARPDLNPEGVIVIGQSAGGWGTVAYDSIPHPHVSVFINMAGGRGGHYHDIAGNNCHPERLITAAGRFGKTAGTPILWIYAQNDSYFNPPLAQAMYQAFTQSGGRGRFVAADTFGKDGHHLFFGKGGADIWGRDVETFIQSASLRHSW